MTDATITTLSKISIKNQANKVINTFYYDPSITKSPYNTEGMNSLANGVINKLPAGLDIRDALSVLNDAYKTLRAQYQAAFDASFDEDALNKLVDEIFGDAVVPQPEVEEEVTNQSAGQPPAELIDLLKELGINPDDVEIIKL